MTVLPGISLYNQDRLPDDDFVQNFVARGETVELLLNVLRHAAVGGETEHQVLIGPRGMGKTSMLRRVAIGIGKDAILGERFVPLRFREEQYNVISLDAFWRNCGEALAEWCEANRCQTMADELDRATDSEEWRDAETAATAFLDFCGRLGRRPCLFLDNLDLVLEGLSGVGWELRHVFQRVDGPFVIGAATQPLAEQANRDDPFYEFFHPIYLEPLTERELLQCMHALADRRGDPGSQVKAVLANSPERIRTLYALTGGNPRILSLIYLLLEKADTETVFGDLEALLDQVTPFYKARVEEYQGAQQRAIIDGIALNWDPITSSALSDITGIEVTTISSQLARLKRDGFVEQVPTSGTRDGYQLSERFLNIWYLMRHGTRKTKQRLRWLAIFLTKLFSAEELGQMVSLARSEEMGNRWHPDFREAVFEAYSTSELESDPALDAATNDYQNTNRNANTSKLKSLVDHASDLFQQRHFNESLAVVEKIAELLEGQNGLSWRYLQALNLQNKGVLLEEIGRSKEAINCFDLVVARFGSEGDPKLRSVVARSLLNKGQSLANLSHAEAALTTYDQVVSMFSRAPDLELTTDVASALLNKASMLDQLGRSQEEIATYDEIVTRFGDSSELETLRHLAATLFNKGIALASLGRTRDAIIANEELERRFGNTDDPVLQTTLAKALVNKANILGRAGHNEEAIPAFNDVLHRFGDVTDPNILVEVARALVGKGITLGRQNRAEEAVAVYDEVEVRFRGTSDRALQEQLFRAMTDKGVNFIRLGRYKDALQVYELIGQYDDSIKAARQDVLGIALYNKGVAFGLLGDSEAALAMFKEVAIRFDGDKPTAVREAVARALLAQAGVLDNLGREVEAIAVCETLADKFGASKEPVLRQHVALALASKAAILARMGQTDEALITFDQVLAQFRDASEPELQEVVATAHGGAGRVLYHLLGEASRAEVHYRRALAIREEPTDAANLAWSLIAQHRDVEAQQVRNTLQGVDPEGLALIDAGIEIVQDNFGAAASHLGRALTTELKPNASVYFEDILWLIRLGVNKGYGEKLIDWFSSTGYAERYAPVYGALVARVRGERFLLDLNPETRRTANHFYRVLAVTGPVAAPTPAKTSRRRTRRRRR